MIHIDAGMLVVAAFGAVIISGLIFGLVVDVRAAKAEDKRFEMTMTRMMVKVPPDRQAAFTAQFSGARKNPTTAVLLALFLGGLGAHKFYLGQTGMGFVYLLFCWTYIPAIISFFESFTLPRTVGRCNEEKAWEILCVINGQPVRLAPSAQM